MRRTPLIAGLGLVVLLAACSDDDDPTGPGPEENPDFTEGTTLDEATGNFMTSLDASNADDFTGFSFGSQNIVHDLSTVAAADNWDIALSREKVKLNGGASGEGTVEGASLGAVDFASVDAAMAVDAEWASDAIEYFMDNWYTYNSTTHQLDMTEYVYSMLDASGNHWVKFRIDALTGAAQGSMGTVEISYFFQSEAGSKSLDGDIQTASIDVGFGVGYFDFSTGQQVMPADPLTSMEWDLVFTQFTMGMNSGPNGSGECGAFYAYSELDDVTAIEDFTMQPEAPLFTDAPGSVMTEWYNYDGTTHTLNSKDHVYLVRRGDALYKLQIDSYYGSINGQPASAHYTLIWDELD